MLVLNLLSASAHAEMPYVWAMGTFPIYTYGRYIVAATLFQIILHAMRSRAAVRSSPRDSCTILRQVTVFFHLPRTSESPDSSAHLQEMRVVHRELPRSDITDTYCTHG